MAVHFDRVGEEGHVGSVSTQEKGPNDIYIYIYRSAKTQEFSSWGALVEASDLFFPFWPVRLAETWLPTQHSGSQHPELHCGVLSPRFVDQQVPK